MFLCTIFQTYEARQHFVTNVELENITKQRPDYNDKSNNKYYIKGGLNP